MQERLEERLATLRGEYNKGQIRIRQIEGELALLRETMLRISGAILVLQEILTPETARMSELANGSAGAADRLNPCLGTIDLELPANKEEKSWVHGQ